MDELIDVSIVGEPVVYGAGFIALLLVVFAQQWAGSFVTIVHEGGHMVMAVLTFRGFSSWSMKDGNNAGTIVDDGSWGVGDLIVSIAGYLSPPLVGLGLAAVVASGNAWGGLAITLLLLVLSFLYARGGLAILMTSLFAVGVALVLWRGSEILQLTVAAGAVWVLLIGGVRSAFRMELKGTSDAYFMMRGTLIPRTVWKLFWITVALVCLYAGGRLLLVGDAWPDGVWPFDVPAEA
ncbi:M50 family metallopeptidase [Actinomycetospora soli]|uniref:M50 family metallopeptidase n=1 Tax=Actinomycetospora soli TaxID=2893887 RepID=UPI001E4DBE86|nr:M50 family metallopeptidase [Actinomycetospora soli]MCD2187579.1 M50 family metallopeptidase [Actinomycetospora soli]